MGVGGYKGAAFETQEAMKAIFGEFFKRLSRNTYSFVSVRVLVQTTGVALSLYLIKLHSFQNQMRHVVI